MIFVMNLLTNNMISVQLVYRVARPCDVSSHMYVSKPITKYTCQEGQFNIRNLRTFSGIIQIGLL